MNEVSLGRPPSPLLERETELATLEEAIDAASGGRLVVIEGHAGIGKTALLEAGHQRARRSGIELLTARSGEPERDFPFGVALQLFEPSLAAAGPDAERLLAGAAGLAAPLFDGTRWGRTLPEDEPALFALLHGLHRLTANLAQRSGLVVSVDDAQWSDASSLSFLLYLAQRLDQVPVTLLMTTRPMGPDPAPDPLAELVTHPRAEVLRLGALSAGAVDRLVRELAFPEAADEFCLACAEVTAGNPLLVGELVKALQEAAVLPDAAAARTVRETASGRVARRLLLGLRRLGREAFDLAVATAVLGDDAALRYAAALAELEPHMTARALDALVAAEVLQTGEPLSFVHPIVRASLYADRPAGARARAHLRSARLLAHDGAEVERVAGHLLRAQTGGDPWVVETLRAAAERATARGASTTAAAYLRRALEEPPPREARPDLLLALADAEATSGVPEAIDRLAEAADMVDDPDRQARVLFLLGRRLYAGGRYREAASAFDRGLARLNGRDPELAMKLEAGYVTAARLDVSTRPDALARLEPLLDRSGAASTEMERILLAHLAFERAMAGQSSAEVAQIARRALGGGALLADRETDGMAFYVACTALGYADELDEAVTALDGAVEAAARRGSALDLARACEFRAHALFRLGRIDDAVVDARCALADAGEGVEVGGPATSAVLAQALMERGELDPAAAALDLPDVESRWASTAPYAYFLESRARLRVLMGAADRALDDLLACGRLLERLRAPNPSVLPWRSAAALAAAKVGDADAARRLADEEIALAREFGAPRAIGIALRRAGLLHGGTAGLDLLREAAATLERSPARLEHGRALTDLGATLRRTGKRSEARELLRRGLDLAERCGATALAEQATQELIAAGAKVRQGPRTGAEVLTPGERRVVHLAAEGLTNKAIADSLFVTVKAVEWHLSHAYRKLGIRSRRELGPALAGSPQPESAQASRRRR